MPVTVPAPHTHPKANTTQSNPPIGLNAIPQSNLQSNTAKQQGHTHATPHAHICTHCMIPVTIQLLGLTLLVAPYCSARANNSRPRSSTHTISATWITQHTQCHVLICHFQVSSNASENVSNPVSYAETCSSATSITHNHGQLKQSHNHT